MSNYPPGVTDADIDYHFGGHDEPDVWPEHNNDIDDWCPWSGQAVTGNDTRCPAGCRDSDIEE